MFEDVQILIPNILERGLRLTNPGTVTGYFSSSFLSLILGLNLGDNSAQKGFEPAENRCSDGMVFAWKAITLAFTLIQQIA